MNNIDIQYQALLQDILDNGVVKKDRTGTGTTSVFGRQIRHKMSEGFPLLTTKKMHWKSVVTELLWFLRGDTNIKFLLDYDCHIWDGDIWANYQRKMLEKFYDDTTIAGYAITNKEEFINKIKTDDKFAKQWGELGPIYGNQWRNWNGKPEQITDYKGGEINPYFCDCQERIEDGNSKVRKKNEGVDQIANLIEQLKTNPDSRRLMVSAWNVGELNDMVLPPCHYGFQVYTRELTLSERYEWLKNNSDINDWVIKHYMSPKSMKYMDDNNVPKRAISLMWNQRSVDTFLGLPFNIASYALLLEIIAREVNMVPEELVGNLGDTHLYLNHVDQAKEQITRTPYKLPSVKITEYNWYLHEAVKEHLGEKTFNEKILSYRPDCFELIDYQSHPKIKAKLSN
jgi:thymidylate synthase